MNNWGKIGQLSRDVIGRLQLSRGVIGNETRVVILLVRFDPCMVPVKRSFIVSQIFGCPVIL